VPVAVNCCVPPGAIVKLAGVTAIETSVAAVTVRTVDPLTEPEVAVIVDVPTETAVANPAEFMLAMLVAEEVQVTELVRFEVVPLL
jgi:hypothetical protein